MSSTHNCDTTLLAIPRMFVMTRKKLQWQWNNSINFIRFHFIPSIPIIFSKCWDFSNNLLVQDAIKSIFHKFACEKKNNTHPNNEPKNPFEVVNFFSASAISCKAFCSLSAIFDELTKNFTPNYHDWSIIYALFNE